VAAPRLPQLRRAVARQLQARPVAGGALAHGPPGARLPRGGAARAGRARGGRALQASPGGGPAALRRLAMPVLAE
jgi:hypothetical protein